MNELTFEVLNIIYDFCHDDSYKIIDVNDIILALPEGVDCDIEKLFALIDDLATEEAINLKYRDEEDICVAITVKGKRIVKKERETRAKIEAQRKAREEEERRRQEQAEKERLEREKKLEDARLALIEMEANKKLKKAHEFVELKHQVEVLENEIKQDAIDSTEKASNNSPVIEEANNPVSVQTMDFVPMVRKVGRIAFWGGLSGAILGNGLFQLARHIMEVLGI